MLRECHESRELETEVLRKIRAHSREENNRRMEKIDP
jgi:hypothetical protein